MRSRASAAAGILHPGDHTREVVARLVR